VSPPPARGRAFAKRVPRRSSESEGGRSQAPSDLASYGSASLPRDHPFLSNPRRQTAHQAMWRPSFQPALLLLLNSPHDGVPLRLPQSTGREAHKEIIGLTPHEKPFCLRARLVTSILKIVEGRRRAVGTGHHAVGGQHSRLPCFIAESLPSPPTGRCSSGNRATLKVCGHRAVASSCEGKRR
jgi:hypothetical protein